MKGLFDKASTTVKIIIGITSTIALLFLIYKVYKYVLDKRNNSIIDNTSATVSTSGGAVTINIGTKASEINDALHGSWWSEDEVKAVDAVLQVPKTLIPKLSATYFSISGKNLKTDLQSYLSSDQYTSIQHLFN